MESTIHAGQHVLVRWMGWGVNIDTILITWCTFILIFIFIFFATRHVTMIPGRVQNAFEMVLELLSEQFRPSLGKYADSMSSFLFSFFLFILVSNEVGLLPNPGHVIKSPTSDLNTTVALAVVTMVLVWYMGIRAKGLHFFGHFFKPFKVFFIINAVEEVAKPITLAFRLFGNILAGEILLELLYHLVPYVAPIIWLAFSLIIGIIQAIIFTLLSAAYIGMATNEDH